MSNKKYSYLAKNTLLFTISSIGSKLLAFLLVPLYTSVLTTAEYGTADLVTTTATLLIFVVTICIADAVLRFGIDGAESRAGVFRYGLKVSFVGFALFGILLFVFSLLNPLNWDKYLYLFLYLTLCSNALNQIVSNYLRAIDRIGSVAIMGLLTTVLIVISNLLLLLVFNMGVIGYLISFVNGYFFASIYGLIIIFKHDRESFRQICDKETRRQMIKYSLPLIPNGLAWWMNSSLDRYFIIFFCGVSANGLYAVASKIPTILMVVNQIFHQAWNLSAIKEFDSDDKEGFFTTMYSLYNYLLVFCCSVLIIMNIPLAKILFAKDFFGAWEYSSILLLSAVFSSLSGFIGSIFVAVKNSKIFALSTVVAAIVNTVLNTLLIPVYGVYGAAIATVISFFVIWIIRYRCAIKYIKMNVNLFRDILTYCMLAGQIVFEHFFPQYFYAQVAVLVVICILYISETKLAFRMIRRVGKKVKSHRKK